MARADAAKDGGRFDWSEAEQIERLTLVRLQWPAFEASEWVKPHPGLLHLTTYDY